MVECCYSIRSTNQDDCMPMNFALAFSVLFLQKLPRRMHECCCSCAFLSGSLSVDCTLFMGMHSSSHSGQCSSEQHCDAADINAGAGQDMSFVDSKKRCRCEFKLQLLVSPCRFFLGGVSSLRGFHADRVGPSEPRLGSHLQVQLFLLSGNSACHSPCHLMVMKTCTLI